MQDISFTLSLLRLRAVPFPIDIIIYLVYVAATGPVPAIKPLNAHSLNRSKLHVSTNAVIMASTGLFIPH